MDKKTQGEIIAQMQTLLAEMAKNLKVKNLNQKTSHKKEETSKTYKGPKGGVLLLFNEGFFKKPRSSVEVSNRLRQDGYHYMSQVISTALVRLVRDRILVRISSEKSAGNEKWLYAERK